MTNEPDETMFSTGLAGLLFGDIRDNELVKNNPIEESYDISGTYIPTRAIVSGFGSTSRYAGGYFLDVALFGIICLLVLLVKGLVYLTEG